MCSNALAMIKNMTDTDVANYEMKMGITKSRRLMAATAKSEGGVQWLEWMSTADRHLLQAAEVKADVVVAADESGNFKTVSVAVSCARETLRRCVFPWRTEGRKQKEAAAMLSPAKIIKSLGGKISLVKVYVMWHFRV